MLRGLGPRASSFLGITLQNSKNKYEPQKLGAPVAPFYPFSFWVPLLNRIVGKKGTLIIKGLLGNLEKGTTVGPLGRAR